jgi:hypothetical protein
MPFEYPTDQRDNLNVYASLIASFWTTLFGNVDNVVDLLRTYKLSERQLAGQMQELQDTVGRQTCPVHHTQDWYELTLLLSTRQAGPIPGSVSYVLPAVLQNCLQVTNAITTPSAAWHNGVSMTIDPVNHLINFAADPFNDPNVVPVPVHDSTGTVIDTALTLWLFKAKLDWQYLYEQFGYVVGVGQDMASTYALKTLLNAVYDAYTAGSTYDAVSRLLTALTDIPLAVGNETVQAITQDATNLLVITDQTVYKFSPDATAVVLPGQQLNRNDPLTDALQIIEPTAGVIPPIISQLSLGPGFLLVDISNELLFKNASVPLNVQTGVSGYTKLTWQLGGFTTDVTTFFNDLHSRGVAAGATLANYLDTRTVPVGQPTAADLPTGINPLQFLVQNVLRNNCLFVYLKVDQFGPKALGTGLASLLRQVVPPHMTVIVYAEVVQATEAVTMNGVGSLTNPGYAESYSLYTTPG